MTFLQKIVKGYVDDSGQFHIISKTIQPRSPDIALPPELKQASGYSGEEPRASKGRDADRAPKAKGPVIHRKSPGEQPSLSSTVTDDEADQALKDMGLADSYAREWTRAMNEAYEQAVDRSPHWSEDL